ncbi:hypothetical protein ACWEO1_18545 [Kitasatospora cineracea]
MVHWMVTVYGAVRIRRRSLAHADHTRIWDNADSTFGTPPEPPPAFETTQLRCPHCGSTSDFLIAGDWGSPGGFTCLRCDQEFTLDDPVLAAGLLKEAVLAFISQSPERDDDALWQAPVPSLTDVVRPLVDKARAAFAAGLWPLPDRTVASLQTLLDRLHRPEHDSAFLLGERIDHIQGAVVALHEWRGDESEIGQWLANCGQTLARAVSFSNTKFRNSPPYGLTDAEDALALFSEELRRTINSVGTA